MLDLFDFDFNVEKEGLMTEEKTSEQFKILQKLFKDKGNPYCFQIKNLPRNMIMFLDEFEGRGWISQNVDSINIHDEHIDFHTAEELIAMFNKDIEKVSDPAKNNWYKDVNPTINFSSNPIRWKGKEKGIFLEYRLDVIKELAFNFGLKHFLDVPSARGMKMDCINTKWAKENTLPIIIENVKEINDYDDMEKYFDTHIFFLGKGEYVPYPSFRKLLPGYLDIASLVQATEDKHIKLILQYCGAAFGGAACPVEWDKVVWAGQIRSIEEYCNSLSDEEIEYLHQDRERLKSLHDRDIMQDNPIFKYI